MWHPGACGSEGYVDRVLSTLASGNSRFIMCVMTTPIASNLRLEARAELVRMIGAKLSVSGHAHEACDYRIGQARRIRNSDGFVDEHRDSRLSRPDWIVEVSA